MEKAIEVDVDNSIAKQLLCRRGKKKAKAALKKKPGLGQIGKDEIAIAGKEGCVPGSNLGSAEDHSDSPECPGITVSNFDYSVENHFEAVNTISNLCGEASDDLDKDEIHRLSSSITFLREWRQFNYQPRVVRFSCQNEEPEGRDVIGGIKLPQFSAANVPKKEGQNENIISPQCSKDFVMYVGGPIWALDWCPRVHQMSDSRVTNEFIAVAAHPPESCYHKIGAPLTGRGVIQVWCVLNVCEKEEEVLTQVGEKKKRNCRVTKANSVISDQPKKPLGRPRKKTIREPVDNCNNQSQITKIIKADQPKRPRGRPRKKPANESVDNCSNLDVQALAIEYPETSAKPLLMDGDALCYDENLGEIQRGTKCKGSNDGISTDNLPLTVSIRKKRLKNRAKEGSQIHDDALLTFVQNENQEAMSENPESCSTYEQTSMGIRVSCSTYGQNSMGICEPCSTLETGPASSPIPKDVCVPRVMLCLAHNGKVAWDLKWRPSDICGATSKHRMGYLAVLLGSGALEVWEVPFPRTIKTIYSGCQKDGIDPRFIKLEPVFKCSKLQFGNRQSIPLTMEWSTSPSHDLILAGCHDGMVALWKFSANCTSKETRPLLCFSADSVPIRALAWAPVESDNESANLIVTAGHRGVKFWDIRDPFQPLWELHPVQRVIYSLDWLSDPRCVVLSFDDGSLRILSLMKAACDITQQPGFNCYSPLQFAIWSVHVSRVTGMVAYCSADGTVLHFLLTRKEAEKDDARNRFPHYICGSLTEEETGLTVVTPLPNHPFPMKKSEKDGGNTPKIMGKSPSESTKARKRKGQMLNGQTSDNQILALCYGDGLETGHDPEDAIASQKSEETPKSKVSSKGKRKADEAVECTDKDTEKKGQKGECIEGKAVKKIEKYPPKSIAMHKVRWNMNKGSERWLCYGGAAGILRCQQI